MDVYKHNQVDNSILSLHWKVITAFWPKNAGGGEREREREREREKNQAIYNKYFFQTDNSTIIGCVCVCVCE